MVVALTAIMDITWTAQVHAFYPILFVRLMILILGIVFPAIKDTKI